MNIKTFLIMAIMGFATYGNVQMTVKSLSPIFKRQLAVMVFLIISILPITAQETNQTSKEKQKVESSRLPFMNVTSNWQKYPVFGDWLSLFEMKRWKDGELTLPFIDNNK